MSRNYRLATLGKNTITAFELTVSQVLSLYFGAGDLKTDDLEQFNAVLFNRVFNDDDFLKVSGKLSEKEQQAALDFWIETNKAFFEHDKKGGKTFANFKYLYKNLAESVANIIYSRHQHITVSSHPNCLNYNWSFFLIVIKTLEEK